jgi:ferredoxin
VPQPPSPSAPRVRCLPRGDVLRPRPGETLLDAARRQDVPLASSCSGHAVCGDCIVRIVSETAPLPPPDADELAWRARRRYDGAGRLACRLRATADCAISTTYW